MKIPAGNLDRRITIQSVTETQNALNGRDVSTTVVATVWCKWQDLRGRELMAQGQMAEVAEARCIIRWRSDVTAQHQVVYEGVVYAIVGKPIELGRREYLELMVSSTPRERGTATL